MSSTIMDHNIINIALVIKTNGLEYDDRVRKEILSVQKLFPQIRFKIFAMLPENKSFEGITGYGVPYKAVFIPARNKYPSAQKVLLKAWQFQKSIEKDLKKYDAVWCANDDTLLTVLLTKNKRILWDLHEIPATLTGNLVKRKVLSFLFHRCKVIVHANPQRAKYLESLGVVKQQSKHFSLRNYPNFDDEEDVFDDKYISFKEWLGEKKCVYLQSLVEDRRAAYESLKAVLQIPDLCAVVVGGLHGLSKERLIQEYGDEFEHRIMLIGKMPQLRIPQFVRHCFLSLIFYKNVNPNHFYCEANRFYQSVILGLPVVVGNNPSMKELVEKYELGISIDDDGSDVVKISSGIQSVLNNYDYYHKNTLLHRNKLIWDTQEDTICEIVNLLIK